jgi:hypothetical protein
LVSLSGFPENRLAIPETKFTGKFVQNVEVEIFAGLAMPIEKNVLNAARYSANYLIYTISLQDTLANSRIRVMLKYLYNWV